MSRIVRTISASIYQNLPLVLPQMTNVLKQPRLRTITTIWPLRRLLPSVVPVPSPPISDLVIVCQAPRTWTFGSPALKLLGGFAPSSRKQKLSGECNSPCLRDTAKGATTRYVAVESSCAKYFFTEATCLDVL